MIKRGIVKGKLLVNSAEARLNGSCPLMPEEVREYVLTFDMANFSGSVNLVGTTLRTSVINRRCNIS